MFLRMLLGSMLGQRSNIFYSSARQVDGDVVLRELATASSSTAFIFLTKSHYSPLALSFLFF